MGTISYCSLDRVPYYKGCPRELSPYYQISTLPANKRKTAEIVHKFTTMKLVHETKEGEIKNCLPLDEIHHLLEMDSLKLQGSGSSNILLSTVSFDCLIKDGERTYRDNIVFDLRIPGANTEKEAVFSYDNVKELFGSKKNLYKTFKYFYRLGRKIINKENYKHGHDPNYDPSSAEHDQYIRHSEPYLIAYLALPEAAEMLNKRLRTEIRGKYPEVVSVKIYSMGLHMHSTKTCCAPCEYSFIGLMNYYKRFKQNGKKIGFLRNFKKKCSVPNERLTFTFPKKSRFRLIVTVTASESDRHHRKKPEYTTKKIKYRDKVPFFNISVKKVQKHIFTTRLDNPFNRLRLSSFSTLEDRTVCVSGSKKTPGTSSTVNKTNQVREDSIKLKYPINCF